MNLNVPDTRQSLLADRLEAGQHIVAIEAAREFGVSVDTIRRDILAMEAAGKAHRVRGGAIPVATPALPLHERLEGAAAISVDMVEAALHEIGQASTILVDGGTTTLRIMEHLQILPDRLVMTPSPWIAIACQARGIEVFLLGGRLRPQGGIATGDSALEQIGKVAVDVALLGACGLDAKFGLSSDDHDEAHMKRAMQRAAKRAIVVTLGDKIGRKARHHTFAVHQIDTVVTDAPSHQTARLVAAGTRVVTP
ncbi:MAG: DeoR/GlpR family DNA-binding transcription regulator [Pseudomonadota bacterium]